MSTPSKEAPAKKDEAPAAGKKDAGAKKGGAGGAIIGIVLSATLAGGAAFGGARAALHSQGGHEEEKPKLKPPGPTVPLEPFLANVQDEAGKSHAIKVTVAIELDREQKEDEFKVYVPRVRDVTLSHLRELKYEELANPATAEQMRKELLERWHQVGAIGAQQVLITDLIIQ